MMKVFCLSGLGDYREGRGKAGRSEGNLAFSRYTCKRSSAACVLRSGYVQRGKPAGIQQPSCTQRGTREHVCIADEHLWNASTSAHNTGAQAEAACVQTRAKLSKKACTRDCAAQLQ